MAKTKKNKRQDADALHSKKTAVKTKKLNPFEIHVNKEKFKILGRKCKHDRGLPGVSRAKAQQKRKATLGHEYRDKHKTNKFKDNRIGHGANNFTDELANARFTAEKLTQFKVNKKNLFNLNDDEVLTHRGQTLEEIEQFREPESEGTDDEGLDAEFTETAHFGGGGDADKTDRKAAIEEMIAEAKRKKAEAAKDKDEVYELTTKLDANYKSLISVIGKLNKNDEKNRKPPPDDYDRALREMVFEPRGAVTDKLQSEEEIVRKERERLEKLEQDRMARMRGEEPTAEPKPTHRSADALDDGYFVESDNEEEPTLAYDLNGKMNGDGAEEADDNEEKDEALGDDSLENVNEKEIDEDQEEDEDQAEEEDSEEGEEEEESDEDSLDDLKVSDSESEEEEQETTQEKKNSSKRKSLPVENETPQSKKSKTEIDLSFTYDMPNSYENLAELLEKQSADHQALIIERIIKCNHPKLDPSNKAKMIKLFAYLLQHVNDIFSEAGEETIKTAFLKFDRLSPHLYDLVQLCPEQTAHCILEVVKEKYGEYKANPKVFPLLDTIVFFKLISNLFSTSDFRHPIVTPCFLFISHILSRARVRTRKDVASGLLLATIALEYTNLSKRFLPAVINFLLGIVFLAVVKRPIARISIVPPFQSTGPQSALLSLGKKFGGDIKEPVLFSTDLVTPAIDDEFKVRALHSSLRLLSDLVENMTDRVGLGYLVEPFVEMMERVDFDLYPAFVRESHESAKNAVTKIMEQPMKRMVAADKKPKALRLMEPKIVRVYDDKRRPKLSKEKEMRAIMLHKVKRETKGAVREIRRDNAFITKMQLKKQLQSDAERKEKVRRIYAEASVQQGELNSLSRSKKKNKF